MQNLPPLLKILPHLLPRNLDNSHILNRSRDLNPGVEIAVDGIFQQLSQHAAEGFAAASLGDHAFALDHAAQSGDGADLVADGGLDGVEELGGGDCGGGVRGCREGDEGEGEVAFESVGDADDAAFGDGGVGGDGLLDRAWERLVLWQVAVVGKKAATCLC